MKSNKMFGLVLCLGMSVMMLMFGVSGSVEAQYYPEQTPVIDAELGVNEYQNGVVYTGFDDCTGDGGSNDTIYFYVINDVDYMYICIDAISQNETLSDCYYEVGIDIDGDGYLNTTYEPYLWFYDDFTTPDLWISNYNEWMCRDYGGFWGVYDDNITDNTSVRGVDGELKLTTSMNNDTNHTIYEMKIPLVASWVNGMFSYNMTENETVNLVFYGYYDDHPYGCFGSSTSYLGNSTINLLDYEEYTIATERNPNFIDGESADGDETAGEDAETDVGVELFSSGFWNAYTIGAVAVVCVAVVGVGYWMFVVRKP